MDKDIIDIKFRIAVKAFVLHNNHLLVLKRSSDDVQRPDIWEIPGGRLELGEDPILGTIREIREETGLYITPKIPLTIRHFTSDDKQIITMIVFFCKLAGGTQKISHEHSEIEWIPLEEAKEKLTDFFHKEVDVLYKLNLHNLIDF